MKRMTLTSVMLLILVMHLSAWSNADYGQDHLRLDEVEDSRLVMLFAQNPSEEQDQNRKEIKLDVKIDKDAHEVDMEEVNRKINEAMQKVEIATRGLDNLPGHRMVSVNITRPSSESPFMGIVSQDMTLKQAADLGYNKFYGVLVARVSPNTPARNQRILPNDIMMEIDGTKITNREILLNVVDSYNVGDTVELKMFRNRQEMTMPFTFGSRHGDEGVPAVSVRDTKPKISLGSGGLSWIPVWYTPDNDHINEQLDDLGFTRLDEEGQFLNGGGLKLNIGNGLFLGGMLAGYSLERKTNPYPNDADKDVMRKMNYSTLYGGITLERRIAITRNLITSVGSMLGWGRTTLDISQTDGAYNWGVISDELSESQNNHINISKSHIFLQPKMELYYRLNSWLSIRGEVGYIASYSYDSGWKATVSGEDYEIKGSPETSFDGMTISVGPWFGF